MGTRLIKKKKKWKPDSLSHMIIIFDTFHASLIVNAMLKRKYFDTV